MEMTKHADVFVLGWKIKGADAQTLHLAIKEGEYASLWRCVDADSILATPGYNICTGYVFEPPRDTTEKKLQDAQSKGKTPIEALRDMYGAQAVQALRDLETDTKIPISDETLIREARVYRMPSPMTPYLPRGVERVIRDAGARVKSFCKPHETPGQDEDTRKASIDVVVEMPECKCFAIRVAWPFYDEQWADAFENASANSQTTAVAACAIATDIRQLK